jgi:hypothetical protein
MLADNAKLSVTKDGPTVDFAKRRASHASIVRCPRQNKTARYFKYCRSSKRIMPTSRLCVKSMPLGIRSCAKRTLPCAERTQSYAKRLLLYAPNSGDFVRPMLEVVARLQEMFRLLSILVGRL